MQTELIAVFRDADGEDNEREHIAEGCVLPSGTAVIEWDREAFPEDERTEGRTESRYEGGIEDVEQATGGKVVSASTELGLLR